METPSRPRSHAYVDLARQLSARGYAVLRYARDGAVVVNEEKANAHKRFAEKVKVLRRACQILRDLEPGIKGLAVAGHSEGRVVALMLLMEPRAENTRVDAYISLSGPAFLFFDVMMNQVEANSRNGIMEFSGSRVSLNLYKRSILMIRYGENIPQDIVEKLPPYGFRARNEEDKQYLRDYDTVDPSKLIAEVNVPVIIVHGGRDVSVPPDNADKLFEAGRGAKVGTCRAFFPELQHYYKWMPPGMSAMEAIGLDTESDEEVSGAIRKWLSLLS
jgi:pimeloyl-ACP methyl ester carboxylesterase